MPDAHATSAEYAAYSGQMSPADVDRKLARASEVVDEWTTTAYATVATTGIATDTTQAGALRDATCAVVESWELGDELGDVQDGGMESGPGREPASGLPARARRHLHLADLI